MTPSARLVLAIVRMRRSATIGEISEATDHLPSHARLHEAQVYRVVRKLVGLGSLEKIGQASVRRGARQSGRMPSVYRATSAAYRDIATKRTA